MKMAIPDTPVLFMKPPTSVIGNGDNIIYPSQTKNLHYEGELAVVIKDKIKNISIENAAEHIKGFTCCNDFVLGRKRRNQVQDG